MTLQAIPDLKKSEVKSDLAEKFLQKLDGSLDPVFGYRIIWPDKSAKKEAMNRFDKFSNLAEELTRFNLQGWGIFHTPNVLTGKGFSKESVIGVRSFFADQDDPSVDIDKIFKFKLIPQIQVNTSPGKYHAYWTLNPEDREKAIPLFTQIQEALIERFETDPSIKDLPRIMRTPGFFHTKKEPWVLSTVVYSEKAPVNYSLAEILDAFEIKSTDKKPKPKRAEPLPAVIKVGEQETRMVSFLGSMRRAGATEDGMMAAAQVENKKRFIPPIKIEDIQRMVHSICKKPTGEEAAPQENEKKIERLNKEYALGWLGTNYVILWEEVDPITSKTTVSFIEEKDLGLSLENQFAWIQGKNGPTRIQLKDFWLKNPDRRQYRKIVMEPDCSTPGNYNLWRGWAVKPDPRGEEGCKLFLDHLKNVLCDGSEDHYQWTLAWLAQAIQEPNNRPGTVIVWRSKEGAGKGIAVEYFAKIWGGHYLHLYDKNQLVKKFNDHLKNALLIFGDECFFGGDREAANILKSIVSDPTLIIEPKFKSATQVTNHLRLILATNEDWILPTGEQARRYFMPTVSDKKLNDRPYFNSLAAEMDNGGSECLLHYLKQFDFKNIDLREVPKTDILLEQKHLSLNPAQRFWYERLIEGDPMERLYDREGWENYSIEGEAGKEKAVVRKEALYQSYVDSSKDANDRYRTSRELFWHQIKKLLPLGTDISYSKREFKKFTRETDSDDKEPKITTEYFRAALIPSLEECRASFEKEIRQKVSWPKVIEENPQFGAYSGLSRWGDSK